MKDEWVTYSGMFVTRDETTRPLAISFSKPTLTEHGDFQCKLVIDGLSKHHEETLVGADGVQALCLALNLAKSLVEDSDEFRESLIVYEDQTPIDPMVRVSF